MPDRRSGFDVSMWEGYPGATAQNEKAAFELLQQYLQSQG
jgi:hypothetical protein